MTPPTTISTGPISTTAVTSPRPVAECPLRGVAFFRNQFSCTKFVLCFDGVAIDKTCSPGLYFSRAQSRCVRRDDSDCLLGDGTCPAENDPDVCLIKRHWN